MKKQKCVFLFLLLFSCCVVYDDGGVSPDTTVKNVTFSPSSGKVGDVIAISGDNFMMQGDMIWEANNQDATYDVNNPGYRCLKGKLVVFNAELTDDTTGYHVNGVNAKEYINFGWSTIYCKIPQGAKTGKIYVANSRENELTQKNYHPSVEIFTVLDASGEIVK